MRNPDRIIPFLRLVEKSWLQQPDLRFGQLIHNMITINTGQKYNLSGNLYYIEDTEFEEYMLRDPDAI